MPASAQHTYDLANSRVDPAIYPETAKTIAVAFGNSLTLAAGTVVGMVTATKKFKAYATGNSDGSEDARAILKYDITTDGSGNITIAGEYGQTSKTAPVYIEGYFKTVELTGLDAAGLADLQARMVTGVLADGIMRF